ncbi:MAG: winged helix-turn-helix domain-containing protein, partial [Pseudomonadota bacterium]
MRRSNNEAVLPAMFLKNARQLSCASDEQNQSQYLYRQLYEYLRQILLNGQLPNGAKIPSSRALARDTGLSRNTVNLAFEQLISEGYLQTRAGAGTFVCDTIPDLSFYPPQDKAFLNTSSNQNAGRKQHQQHDDTRLQISQRGKRLSNNPKHYTGQKRGILFKAQTAK